MPTAKTIYKKMNIPWIGEIPAHWEVRRLKNCIDIIKTGSTPKSSNHKIHFDNGKINWFSPSDMNKDFIDNSKRKVTQNAVENGVVSVFPIKSILITCIGDIGKVSILKEKGSFNQQINGLIFQKGINSMYGFYYLKSQKDKLKSLANFTVLSILSTKELLNLEILLPPLSEQTAIAGYLDRQVEKINHFIKKKRHYIALLEEQRQAIINQAVTQGINANAALKNSGIEGLGEIPAHWQVRRLGSIGSFFKGGNISKSHLVEDEEKQVILYGDIYTKYEFSVSKLVNKISEEIAENATPIYKGDLLFTGSGEDKEDIGKCIAYLGNEEAYAGGDIIIFRQNGFDSEFISYSQNSIYAKHQKYITSKGDIIIHQYGSKLKNVLMPFPSDKQEQTAIVSYIKTKTEKIDLAIGKVQKEMELIQEYKEAMIAEAVLGKLIIEE